MWRHVKLHAIVIRGNYNTNKNNVQEDPLLCATQLAGGLMLRKLKYFEVMLNIFEFSQVLENVES